MRNRVYLNIERPDPKLVEELRGVPTAWISDALDRHGAMHYSIKPLSPEMRLCGPAVTVWARPRDSVFCWKSTEVAKPGDVLVFAFGGYDESSHFGDRIARVFKKLGMEGVVVDGLTRDTTGLKKLGFPVFVRGANPNGPFRSGLGEINVPVVCGGVIVHPGDVIVGDEDGVMVVPKGQLADLVEKLKGIRKKEEGSVEKDVEAGLIIPDAIQAVLDGLDIEIIE